MILCKSVKRKSDMVFRIIILLLVMMLLLKSVYSDPPTPHNVRGFIFHANGVGTENGIPVRVNDTTNGNWTLTQVFAPPIPSLAGAYLTTISGNDGDTVVIYAWNSTNYGTNTTTLNSTTNINVTMNLLRPPEPNVTIVSPANGTAFNYSIPFNLTVNITIIAGAGDCNITLLFSNTTVLNVSAGDSTIHNISGVTSGQNYSTTFSLSGKSLGNSNITAIGTCLPTGQVLEATTTARIILAIVDNIAPTIYVTSPQNNTLNKTSTFAVFNYNVSDNSSIVNCSLYIDQRLNQTNTTITKNINQRFSTLLPNGMHNWSITCYDNYSNQNSSALYNLSIDVVPPAVTVTGLTQNIVLNAGTSKMVQCNVTVTDGDGFSNIIGINSTFYVSNNVSSSPDNNNSHYTNNSCELVSSFGNQKDYSCTYAIWYFAVNGSWICNATAFDNEGLTGNNSTNTTIDPLYALNLSNDFIDFGNVVTGLASSNTTINMSNLGNVPINVSVYGYGLVPGDGNAFVCSTHNISINSIRFAANSTATYNQKTALSATPKLLRLTVRKSTNTTYVPQNTSWWQVMIPINTSDIGTCAGSVLFQAEQS